MRPDTDLDLGRAGYRLSPLAIFSPVLLLKLPIIIRLARPRTWVFASLSFLLGFLYTGGILGWQMITGFLVTGVVTGATNLTNAYTDRLEDSVNQPARVFWLEKLGERNIVSSALLFYGLGLILSVLLGPAFMLVSIVGVFDSVFYSAKPLRLKAHPATALVSFSGAVGIAFLSGMVVSGQLNLLDPLLVFLTFFMLTYGTLKNLPDYSGDKEAGILTSATLFSNIRSAVRATTVFLVTPFIVLTVQVATGLLDTRYLLMLIFAPILFLIISRLQKARDYEDMEKVHSLGYFYAVSTISFALVVTVPSLFAIATILAVFAFVFALAAFSADSRSEIRLSL